MRLLRLCLLIFALRRFLSDPMIVVRYVNVNKKILVNQFVKRIFDDTLGT